jgi:formate dehydrogenase major subunit
VTEIVDAVGRRDIRGLFITGEDLALTEPDLANTRSALATAELIVLQEIFPSETCASRSVSSRKAFRIGAVFYG